MKLNIRSRKKNFICGNFIIEGDWRERKEVAREEQVIKYWSKTIRKVETK